MKEMNKERWLEIRFYYFCYDIYQIRHDHYDIAYAIEAVAQIENFNITKIKHLASRAMTDYTIAPTDQEFIYLSHEAGVPVVNTIKKLKMSRTHYHRLLKKAENFGTEYYPKFMKHDREAISNFLQILKKFQQAGVYYYE